MTKTMFIVILHFYGGDSLEMKEYKFDSLIKCFHQVSLIRDTQSDTLKVNDVKLVTCKREENES